MRNNYVELNNAILFRFDSQQKIKESTIINLLKLSFYFEFLHKNKID